MIQKGTKEWELSSDMFKFASDYSEPPIGYHVDQKEWWDGFHRAAIELEQKYKGTECRYICNDILSAIREEVNRRWERMNTNEKIKST